MVAGRELDEIVAEKVTGVEPVLLWNVLNQDETASAYMGATKTDCERFLEDTLRRMPDSWLKDYHVGALKAWPCYSTSIEAAWQVVEKMKDDRQAAFVLGSNGLSNQISAWFNDGMWALARSQNTCPEHGDKNILGCATADTAPLAICLASLKALGVEIPA